MEKIELENHHGADVRFTGEKIAHATTQTYLRDQTRWTELDLYRSEGGVWICHEIGRTMWEGEEDRFTVYVAVDEQELVQKVGLGRLAKELYDEAGIDHAQDIE